MQDSEGKEIRDGVTGRGGGYRYFGAAKQLPGVRELFEKEPPRKVMPRLSTLPGIYPASWPQHRWLIWNLQRIRAAVRWGIDHPGHLWTGLRNGL